MDETLTRSATLHGTDETLTRSATLHGTDETLHYTARNLSWAGEFCGLQFILIGRYRRAEEAREIALAIFLGAFAQALLDRNGEDRSFQHATWSAGHAIGL